MINGYVFYEPTADLTVMKCLSVLNPIFMDAVLYKLIIKFYKDNIIYEIRLQLAVKIINNVDKLVKYLMLKIIIKLSYIQSVPVRFDNSNNFCSIQYFSIFFF